MERRRISLSRRPEQRRLLVCPTSSFPPQFPPERRPNRHRPSHRAPKLGSSAPRALGACDDDGDGQRARSLACRGRDPVISARSGQRHRRAPPRRPRGLSPALAMRDDQAASAPAPGRPTSAQWPRSSSPCQRGTATRLVLHLRPESESCSRRNGTCRRGHLLHRAWPRRGLASTDDPLSHDYAYALQVLPSAAQIDASSIGALQRGVLDHVAQHDAELRGGRAARWRCTRWCPTSSRARRAKARGLRRAEMLKAKLVSALRAQYAAARPAADGGELETERWLLQLMLLRPDCCLASLARVGHAELGTWPRADAEAGLADVDIAEDMPSSAYRKLLEALSCAGIEVDSSTTRASRTAVDLGAHPGGWTTALRRHGYGRVTAVDRQPLADRWLGGGVEFVQGDAFAFEPAEPPVALMASDVPRIRRVPELSSAGARGAGPRTSSSRRSSPVRCPTLTRSTRRAASPPRTATNRGRSTFSTTRTSSRSCSGCRCSARSSDRKFSESIARLHGYAA